MVGFGGLGDMVVKLKAMGAEMYVFTRDEEKAPEVEKLLWKETRSLLYRRVDDLTLM